MSNEDEEQAKGRIAVWLSPDDIRWLAKHLASIEDENENERLGRLRFRLLTALHKAGLPNNIWEDNEELVPAIFLKLSNSQPKPQNC